MNGIAIIIFIGQIKPFLGISGEWSKFDFPVGWVPMLVAMGSIVAILVSRRVSQAIPGALVGLVEFEQATEFSVHEMLQDMGVIAEIGEENIYADHDFAMEAAEEALLHEHHAGYTEDQPALTLLDFESFQNLQEDEVEKFNTLLKEQTIKADDYLFAKGAMVDSFVLVRKGELIVFKQAKDKDVRIATVSPGAMLGWRALMKDEQRITGGIRAETDVEVYLIPKEALAKLEEEHPTALLHFHRELLKNAVERMQILTSELILLEER